jgi:outer membrane protein assembly factor BamB
MYISVIGDQVQVQVIPESFLILDLRSGEIIEELVDSKVFFHSNFETVVEQNGLQSIDPASGDTNWAATINDEILLAPIFLDDVILLRTGRIIGKITCIDRKAGKFLWISRDDIVSNLVYSSMNESVYALSRDGELLSFDKNSGKETVLVKYTTSPFILNGEQDVGGYEVALDEGNNILFVLLGDSRQLFAFRLE